MPWYRKIPTPNANVANNVTDGQADGILVFLAYPIHVGKSCSKFG